MKKNFLEFVPSMVLNFTNLFCFLFFWGYSIEQRFLPNLFTSYKAKAFVVETLESRDRKKLI